MMTDLSGEFVGNYHLIRQIGHGGFADVYLGNHIYMQTQAAIKILKIQFAENVLESFLSEARTVIQLEHPHIVRIFECGVEKKMPFLVMNYAPGGSLRQRYRLGTRVPLEYVSQHINQIASALQYAHERKLIHRDIKPENMLLGHNDTLLLSDFGLVLPVQSTSANTIQEMAGTLSYMAPEQLQGKPQPASDQYALGIVAYEWLSGERPFRGAFVEIATQHLLSEPQPLYGRIPGISRELEQVVFTALAKSPRNRFASVQAFADALTLAIAPALDTGERIKMPIRLPSSPGLSSITLNSQQSGHTPPVGDQSFIIEETPTQPVSAVSQLNMLTSGKDWQTNLASPTTLNTLSAATTSLPGIGLSADTVSTMKREDLLTLRKTLADSQSATSRRSKLLALAGGFLALLFFLVLAPLLLSPVQQTLSSNTNSTPTMLPTSQTQGTEGVNGIGGMATSTTTQQPNSHVATTATPAPSSDKSTFSVIGVNVSASLSNYQGFCATPVPLTFTATIQVSPVPSGGTVSYIWLRSNNTRGPIETVTFKPGETLLTVTTSWQGPTSPGNTILWEKLETISPNALSSQQASVQFFCTVSNSTPTSISNPTPNPTLKPAPTPTFKPAPTPTLNPTPTPTLRPTPTPTPKPTPTPIPPPPPPFVVNNISVDGNMVSTDCAGVGFSISATITLGAGSPGGRITYTWVHSDGTTSGPISVNVSAGQQQVVVRETWFTPASTSVYWVQLRVSAPNNINSNQKDLFGRVDC